MLSVARKLVAEFLGTLFFLYAVSASTVVPTIYFPDSPAVSVMITALIQGFTLVAIVSTYDSVSGSHLNPAITFTLILIRAISPIVGLLYIIAQLVGAILGCALFALSIGDWNAINMGVPFVNEKLNVGNAFLVEFFITTILLLVVLSTARDLKKASLALAPIPIGYSVFVGVLIAKILTGGSMNPARAFAPALLSSSWRHHWLYWAAPAASSLVTAATYRFVFAGITDASFEDADDIP